MTKQQQLDDLAKRSITCACNECVDMCKHRPCWPTPSEAKAIQDAGLGHRLMEDYWVADKTYPSDVKIMAPAIVRYEGKTAPFFPHGPCTFLVNERCELHDKGLKPLEGRMMSCKSTKEDSDLIREYIVSLWAQT